MAQPDAWCSYNAKTGRCALLVHVQPNARSSAIVGLHGDALKIRVAAPAVDDKANAALLDFLCDEFDLKPAQIAIRHGARSPQTHRDCCRAPLSD
jgi:uncharacterized protein (TIGR00251 family)